MGDLLDLIPGLGQIKLTATTVVYIVIGLAISALIGYGVWEAHEVKTLNTQMGTLTQQNKDLGDANKGLTQTIKGLQASGKVNNDVSNNDVTQKQAATTTTAVITTQTQTAITAVVKKFQPQGPAQVLPASDAQAESAAISTIQVNSMWQTYCAAVPAATAGCAAVPAKASKPTTAPAAQVGPIASQ